MALDESAVRRLVLTELAKSGERYVPVGVSARHVHLTAADVEALFGSGHDLTPIRPLSQPGQFACAEQVTVIGPGGEIGKVRVLGPARSETQVEVTLTDAVRLGLKNLPIRMSGKLQGTPGIKLIGPAGETAPDHGVIVAARHIHMSAPQAAAYGVHDGMVVSVRVGGARPALLQSVVCRTGQGHELELHLDTDEANACGLSTGDYVELVLPGEEGGCRTTAPPAQTAASSAAPPADAGEVLDLVLERDVTAAAARGRMEVRCTRRALVTPAAADRAGELGIRIVRADASYVPASRKPAEPDPGQEALDVVTEADLNAAYLAGRGAIRCFGRAVVTDAAWDRARETGIRIVFEHE